MLRPLAPIREGLIHKDMRQRDASNRTVALAVALLVALVPWCASGQIDRTALTGTIQDSSGRAVPEATISATQVGTGLNRAVVSNSLGAYSIPDLPAGVYRISIRKSGFQQVIYENVEQTVGITRTLNPVLAVSDRTDSVTVSTAVSALDETSAALSGAVEERAILDLPLNGRNWASLTALVPGAIDQGGSGQRTIRFAGRGRDENNYLLDGVDATGIVNQPEKANVRLAIPTESIAEFRVNSMLSSAEYGDAAGAEVAVASLAGTNVWHGSAFEYLRNSFFDARSPLDQTHGPQPFRLNQFGSVLNGPIRKNRTFVFFNYEGLRQQLDQTDIGFVPSAAFRAQVLATSPVLAPIVNAFPTGNGITSSASVNQYTSIGKQIANEDSAMLRIDQIFDERNTAFVRFNNDSATGYAPLGSLLDRQQSITKPRNGVAEYLHVFSPTLLDEFKFGFNQAIAQTFNLTAQADTVSLPSFSGLNGYSTSDQDGTTFSWVDNLTWTGGRHTISAGVLVRKIQMNEGNSATTTLTYSSLTDFTNNNLDSASVLATLPLKRMRKTEESAYVLDQFKLRPNLTISAGLRYQFFSVFHESTNRAIPFDFATCGPGGFCPVGSPFYFPVHDDFDPRVGIAWSPGATHGKTVIRVGAGIYHDDGQLDDQDFPTANDEPRYSLSLGPQFPNLAYPVQPFLVNATGVLSPKDLVRIRKDAYASQWSASVEQSLPGGFTETVSYVGSKGTNIMNRAYTNLIEPAIGGRPYPAFGQIEIRGNNSNSTFQAIQTSLQRRFRRGLLFSFNYMLSHAINDASLGSGVEDDFPENVSCRACDKSSSDEDARQSISAYAVYELPFGAGKRWAAQPGPLRTLLSGWQLNTIAGGRTGLPVNITVTRASTALPDGNAANQRPNYVLGMPLTPPGGSRPSDWINLAAFSVPANGTWGNLGHDAFRGPALWQVDTALSRRIRLRERASLDLRGEMFNIFNRAQYGNPLANISSPATFGAITTLANTTGPTGSGTPRQFQIAVRLFF
jgi:hypothetical protein